MGGPIWAEPNGHMTSCLKGCGLTKMATSGKAYCPWTSRNTLVTSRRSSVTSER